MKKNFLKIINIPKIRDDCFLFFLQTPDQIPFEIKRVYFITEASEGLPRGLHAHKKIMQVMFCISGSINLLLDNGRGKVEVLLDKPEKGVLIDKMVWHEMINFKKNTILLVVASEKYEEEDYIRNYDQFMSLINERR